MRIELKQKHLKDIKFLQQESSIVLNEIKSLQERHSDIISRLQVLSNKLE